MSFTWNILTIIKEVIMNYGIAAHIFDNIKTGLCSRRIKLDKY